MRTSSDRRKALTPALLDLLINPDCPVKFSRANLGITAKKRTASVAAQKPIFASYKGFDVYRIDGVFYSVPETATAINPLNEKWRSNEQLITGTSFAEVVSELDRCEARLVESGPHANICTVLDRYAIVPHPIGQG